MVVNLSKMCFSSLGLSIVRKDICLANKIGQCGGFHTRSRFGIGDLSRDLIPYTSQVNLAYEVSYL